MDRAQEGDDKARSQLWSRYYERLMTLAQMRLPARARRVVDEEDVVLEAFAAFFRALEKRELSPLANRDDLWRLPVVITDNKVRDAGRAWRRQKRGGGQVRGHSAWLLDREQGLEGLGQVPDPTPEFADEFSLACEHLLLKLKPELRRIALWKLASYTNREISQRLGCVEEAVRRKVVLIRKLWADE